LAARQHSPAPLVQGVPSAARHCWVESATWAWTTIGATNAADANSIATLFSFFIESPLKGKLQPCCVKPEP
jgi:hypothetical protein